jgi:hypothetical protein
MQFTNIKLAWQHHRLSQSGLLCFLLSADQQNLHVADTSYHETSSAVGAPALASRKERARSVLCLTNWRSVNFVNKTSWDGTVPVNILEYEHSKVMRVRKPSSGGIFPPRRLLDNSSLSAASNHKRLAGINPISRIVSRFK